ncbi:MAG: DUF1501 domain-containing protein [Isosphaeraceae bacterium]
MLKGDHNWDWHKDLFPEARGTLPLYDLGLSAMLGDLEDRGLLDETLVVAWGEFGPDPEDQQGRRATTGRRSAGCGISRRRFEHGQVIGSTTRQGEEPKTRPSTSARCSPRSTASSASTPSGRYTDLSSRPQSLVGEHQPMPELIGLA